MITRRRFMQLGASAGGALMAGDLLQACGGHQGVRMGLLSASGSQSSSATEQANAFQMAVDEINGQGGVAGHRIDTTTDGSASRLVQNSDVDVIIAQSAPVDSAAIQATSGTVLMHAGSYDPPACPKNVISTGPVPNQQVEPMARWLTKNVGHSVFVVGLANGWCRASLQVLRGMAPTKGGQSLVAAWHLVPAGTTDFSGLLKQVAQVNPAVLWSLMSGDDAIALAKQLAKVDVKALIVSTGWNDVTAAAVPGLLVGALISQPWLMSLSTPESTKFVSSYQRRFGKQPISALGEATYDAVYLYKTAVERAGTTTADQVIKALPQVQFNAPQGLVRIDSATRVIVTNSLIGQVTAQGTIEVHERLGTIDPVLSGCRPG